MTVGLTQSLTSVVYDPRAGQYRGVNGQFVSRSLVLQLLNDETARLQVRLTGLTRRLVSGNLSLSDWQTAFADELKQSHLRMAIFAAGGKSNMTNAQYGAVGRALRDQYKFLNGFAQAIASGKLTPSQILYRTTQYARSSQTSFYRSEMLTKTSEGFNQARRWLGAAIHCNECIDYDTGGQWLPVDQVVPPGVNCSCHHHCKCSIAYRKNFFNNLSTLAQAVTGQPTGTQPTIQQLQNMFRRAGSSNTATGQGRGFGNPG